MKWIKKLFLCRLMGAHDLTTDHDQGIPPDREKMAADPIAYFDEYARMYCTRCDYVRYLR